MSTPSLWDAINTETSRIEAAAPELLPAWKKGHSHGTLDSGGRSYTWEYSDEDESDIYFHIGPPSMTQTYASCLSKSTTSQAKAATR